MFSLEEILTPSFLHANNIDAGFMCHLDDAADLGKQSIALNRYGVCSRSNDGILYQSNTNSSSRSQFFYFGTETVSFQFKI